MTLLVIDLKLPDVAGLHASHDVAAGQITLLPKATSWLISFFVLSLFWLGHHASSTTCAKSTASCSHGT